VRGESPENSALRAGQSDPWDAPQLRTLRELAEQAARAGGLAARQRFGGPLRIRRKPDGSDVTDADEAAQSAVLARLRAGRPADAILAEESLPDSTVAAAASSSPAPSRLCWIVDPLDGTRNYLCGVPIYVCSVAAMFGGYPLVGAIYESERNRMYSASRTEGLLVDGRPFSPTKLVSPQASVLSPTETPLPSGERAGRGAQQRQEPPSAAQFHASETDREVAAAPAEFLPDGRPRRPLVGIPSSLSGPAYAIVQSWAARVVVRNLGATALHLAMVATGQLRAALITDSKLWDIAAGWLMVTATGGVMTTLKGDPVFPLDLSQYTRQSIPSLAAATPETHARLLPPSPA
jgi:fructose-1,6-bisphosphatase/inositol monophosphatase family enzyme